jgi:hypothetical protein
MWLVGRCLIIKFHRTVGFQVVDRIRISRLQSRCAKLSAKTFRLLAIGVNEDGRRHSRQAYQFPRVQTCWKLAQCGFAQRDFDYKLMKIMKHSYMGEKLAIAEKLKHADKRKRSLAQPQQQQQAASINQAQSKRNV